MTTYRVYAGKKSNGDEDVMAIDKDLIEQNSEPHCEQPRDFFFPSTTDIKYEGEFVLIPSQSDEPDASMFAKECFSLNT